MRFISLIAGLTGFAGLAAASFGSADVPPDVAANLEELPVTRVPLRNATLGSAIRLLASESHLSYIAPNEQDFSDRISSDVTMNPYDLLMLLSQDYNFNIEYQHGLWRFKRVDENELITKAYPLHFNNLTHVSIANNDLSTQLAASTTSSSGGMGGAGGGSGMHNSGVGGGGSFDSKTSKILEDVKKILAISGDDGAEGEHHRRTETAEPIWDQDSSTLFVVANQHQHDLVAQYLKTIDHPQKLIRISVKFVETQRNPTQNVGVDWSQTILGNAGPITWSGPQQASSTGGTSGTTGTTGSGANGTSNTSGSSNSTFQPIQKLLSPHGFLPVSMLSAPAMSLTLQAIASDSKSSIVQDPVIFTANNNQVTFKATTEEPIQQGSTTFGSATAATSTEITYLEVGTSLTVLPNVLPGSGRGHELIQCNFSINVSSIVGSQTIGGNPYPITSSRSYSYSVPIPNGKTLAIAGLEERSHIVTDSKVPGLGDVPLLGYAFKNRSDQIVHTTLIAFITPEIIEEPGVDDAVTLPTMHHRPFLGSSSETLSDVRHSLQGLPEDIVALQTCANGDNKEAVLNQLDRIAIELSLIDVRLGEIKLEGDKVTAIQIHAVDADRDLLSHAKDTVVKIRANATSA